jgi:hypothetical protein
LEKNIFLPALEGFFGDFSKNFDDFLKIFDEFFQEFLMIF